jgi:hypothetical protein
MGYGVRGGFHRLLEGPGFAAFVVDASDGAGLASCAVGTYAPRFPSPTSDSPFHGEIHSVVTATMQWLAGQGCSSVRLNASPDGLPLYTELGFRPIPAPAMTWSCRWEAI